MMLTRYSCCTPRAIPDRGARRILSITAEYALRAVVHLAIHERDAPMLASELAAATDVPENYLRKVLHELVRGGVLRSIRGKHGGFWLAVPTRRLTLLDVIGRFDGVTERRRCLPGRAECNDARPCPMHARWKVNAEQLAAFFRSTTVADVVRDQDRAARPPSRKSRS